MTVSKEQELRIDIQGVIDIPFPPALTDSVYDDWLDSTVSQVMSIIAERCVFPDKDRKLPQNPYPKPRMNNPSKESTDRYYSYNRAQEDMAGWRPVEPIEVEKEE